MAKMKYVTVEGMYCPEIYIFPEFVAHNSFAQMMNFRKEDLLGAGFVDMLTMRCYGKSTSLGLESREDDTDILCKLSGINFDE